VEPQVASVDAQQLVEDIRRRQLSSDREFVLASLTGAIDRLQKAFPRYGSFLMEFVQNADDAGAKTLKIEISQDEIVISNDGKEFTAKDVTSICKVGRSSKTPKDYIGYLGVGFKAVFLISERPEIHSGRFSFKFDKRAWDDVINTPWQVIPIWIEGTNPDVGWTRFRLPLKDSKLIDTIRREVSPEQLNERVLLFLRHIEEIDIVDKGTGEERSLLKSTVYSGEGLERSTVAVTMTGQDSQVEEWLIFRRTSSVPQEVRDDYVTKDWERENVETREVLVAFRLDDEGDVVVEPKGTAHIGVFSFLPLKEVQSGLNFLIQADFLTAPGRGELARESLWNEWLAKEVYSLVVQTCIPAFMKDEKWRFSYTLTLYSVQGGHQLFEDHIKNPLRQYLANDPVLVDEDGNPAKVADLIQMSTEVRQLLIGDDIALMFPGKRVMHSSCKPFGYFAVPSAPPTVYQMVSSPTSDELLSKKAELKDVEWFNKVYGAIADTYSLACFQSRHGNYKVEHDRFWDGVAGSDRPIILTDDYRLAAVGDCNLNSDGLEIPANVRQKFNIVHPDLISDKRFQAFIRKLNSERYHWGRPHKTVFNELIEEGVRAVVEEEETLELGSEKWEKLNPEERMDEIRRIKGLHDKGMISIESRKYLTIKSKGGAWMKPEELFFSKEYNPDHHLDEIVNEKKLYDRPISFVSPEFVKDSNELEIQGWYNFFEKLGVESKRENKKFMRDVVARIGVLVALRYERKKGRMSARELSRTEETGGYDLEQTDEQIEGAALVQSPERFVEVKGSSKSDPDIFLTPKQFSMLHEKKEKYFVYVVKDSLGFPSLSVLRGDKLAEITGIKAIFPFDKWSSGAREDEFTPGNETEQASGTS
jgi:Protein NO VEIN, C-terminal